MTTRSRYYSGPLIAKAIEALDAGDKLAFHVAVGFHLQETAGRGSTLEDYLSLKTVEIVSRWPPAIRGVSAWDEAKEKMRCRGT